MQKAPYLSIKTLSISITSACLLAACGGSSSDSDTPGKGENGSLLKKPVTVKSLSPIQLTAMVKGISPTALQLTGVPKCSVKVHYMHYNTVGAAGEKTDATGVVMTPDGKDPQCSGKRPVILHAHGTAVTRSYNFAEVGNPKNEAGFRSTLLAATFAAQGYIVIAPNYAGFDQSKLAYHPYLLASQQSAEMEHALSAGRIVLDTLKPSSTANDKLFLTGYSQGGHVAMATARYFESKGIAVTAAMPMSGPYAMSAFGDAVFYGNINIGATLFAPLMARSYHAAYKNILTNPAEMFTARYVNAYNLLPGAMTERQLFGSGKLPVSAAFQQAPTGIPFLDKLSPFGPKFGYGFDKTNYLIQTSYRAQYLADAKANPDGVFPKQLSLPLPPFNPAHPFRQALKKNDLRTYVPKMPMLLCGGHRDPMVFFPVNTGLMGKIWAGQDTAGPVKFGILDVDSNNAPMPYFSKGFPQASEARFKKIMQNLQQGFSAQLAAVAKTAGQKAAAEVLKKGGTQEQAMAAADQAGKRAVLLGYHSYVSPFCISAAREFFNRF